MIGTKKETQGCVWFLKNLRENVRKRKQRKKWKENKNKGKLIQNQ